MFAAREFAKSNLGWFMKTRQTIGEASGRERAININRDVFDVWFPNKGEDTSPEKIRTRYFDGNQLIQGLHEIVDDKRTIRNQGGGKNWRLAGDGIQGDWYDVRLGDLMLMAFDTASSILAWVVIRQGGDSSRSISAKEESVYQRVHAELGDGNRNMWIIPPLRAARISSIISDIFPKSGELLMLDKAMQTEWEAALDEMGFVVGNNVDLRLPLSLKAKRFVILSGLSGSGKTLLARSFTKWVTESSEQYEIVAVGANWISNENIVGYPDALDRERYEKTKALELILKADRDRSKPYFLILDEMNLSHVERYFADFLSAIESPSEPLRFHYDANGRAGVPSNIASLPSNLFIIGTINVDETTYLFSPKVLDRANIIEFRATGEALSGFLSSPVNAKSGVIESKGAGFGVHFVDSANDDSAVTVADPLVAAIVRGELVALFDLLSRYNSEFGFRTSLEILRYVEFFRRTMDPIVAEDIGTFCRTALDTQIMQKILTRLHGSRKKLAPILNELEVFCVKHHRWASVPSSGQDPREILINIDELSPDENISSEEGLDPFYSLSAEKIKRMKSKLEEGFASYAEA
ncbi:McrB family protein [Pseudodesulfovibrio nedwellii]|uniref:McrB family protein n=1 Tax=Pseudodesulfovibrio nedwellii TaxID=2973072 RepID=UPI002490C3D5|nr:hypothetical protein [Pseudodesulfovibrio nedwellii]